MFVPCAKFQASRSYGFVPPSLPKVSKSLVRIGLRPLMYHRCTNVIYRTISVATAMSKVFERLIAKQINSFVTKKISNLLCAYRKGHNAQNALIRLNETIRKTLDRKSVPAMILMDLSDSCDCMPHDLLIAKLKAYGFGLQGLRLIANYLCNRKQSESWLNI